MPINPFAPVVPHPDEAEFLDWYMRQIAGTQLNPDPYDPRHEYDFYAAWKAGASRDPKTGHWDSRFKTEWHPNRFIFMNGRWMDTKNDRMLSGSVMRDAARWAVPFR